jgi:hypothetical protein
VEKLQTVTDKSALGLGVSVGQFLGEAESNTEFEQVFGKGRDRGHGGLRRRFYPCPLSGPPFTLMAWAEKEVNPESQHRLIVKL